jgi:hypothetical protein
MGFKDIPEVVVGPTTLLKPTLKPSTKGAQERDQSARPPTYTSNASNSMSRGWTGASANALTSGLAAARNPSQAPSGQPAAKRPRSVYMALPDSTPSRVASGVRELSTNDDRRPNYRIKNAVYDPSVGPTKSNMTTTRYQTSAAPSRALSSRSHRTALYDRYCRMSGYTARDFRLGEVIAAPYHTSNTNPNYKPHDRRITFTVEGPAYSKRRMMVVLFIHQQDMFCLPLYSHENRGLDGKPDHIKKEYVCMFNQGDEDFVNQGVYSPVEVIANRPVLATTSVHLTGGTRVGCNEDITGVGRLTRKSYQELVELWDKVVGVAREVPWRR